MKTNMIIFLLVCFTLSANALASNPQQAQEVELKRERNPNEYPRAPELNPVQFDALLYMGELTIYAENYIGSATLEITGPTGIISEVVVFTETEPALVYLGELPEGEYRLSLNTTRGTYIGEFEL